MTKTWPVVVCLVGMAVSGAVLILLLPTLFDDSRTIETWILVLLGVLVLGFGVGARHFKPRRPSAAEE